MHDGYSICDGSAEFPFVMHGLAVDVLCLPRVRDYCVETRDRPSLRLLGLGAYLIPTVKEVRQIGRWEKAKRDVIRV